MAAMDDEDVAKVGAIVLEAAPVEARFVRVLYIWDDPATALHIESRDTPGEAWMSVDMDAFGLMDVMDGIVSKHADVFAEPTRVKLIYERGAEPVLQMESGPHVDFLDF